MDQWLEFMAVVLKGNSMFYTHTHTTTSMHAQRHVHTQSARLLTLNMHCPNVNRHSGPLPSLASSDFQQANLTHVDLEEPTGVFLMCQSPGLKA